MNCDALGRKVWRTCKNLELLQTAPHSSRIRVVFFFLVRRMRHERKTLKKMAARTPFAHVSPPVFHATILFAVYRAAKKGLLEVYGSSNSYFSSVLSKLLACIHAQVYPTQLPAFFYPDFTFRKDRIDFDRRVTGALHPAGYPVYMLHPVASCNTKRLSRI